MTAVPEDQDITGFVVRIPAGREVWWEEDRDRSRSHRVRADTIVSVERGGYTNSAGEIEYRDASNRQRYVQRSAVEVLIPERHLLRIAGRRVVGASPVAGGGNCYKTGGTCSCGMPFSAETAAVLRGNWRRHLLDMVNEPSRRAPGFREDVTRHASGSDRLTALLREQARREADDPGPQTIADYLHADIEIAVWDWNGINGRTITLTPYETENTIKRMVGAGWLACDHHDGALTITDKGLEIATRRRF